MALTTQQQVDVRRFAGYPMLGDTVADDSRDFAYGWVAPGVWQTLFHRLAYERPEEENVLVNTYLANLYLLEKQLMGAGADLDTEKAGPWTRNRDEISDRQRLFDDTRRRMCQFIGVAPGPALGPGGIRLGRC